MLSPFARLCAMTTALLAAGSLTLQVLVVLPETNGSVPATLWVMGRFFTHLTVTLVAIVFGCTAIRGKHSCDRLTAGLVLWIAAVALIYHGVLSTLWDPQGLRYYADQGLHSVVPAAVVLWWLLFAERDKLSWLDPLLWMIWPVAYLIYAVIRGAADGIYPYPFLDPGRVSALQLIWNVSRLMEGFLFGGYILLGLAQPHQSTQLSDSPSSFKSVRPARSSTSITHKSGSNPR